MRILPFKVIYLNVLFTMISGMSGLCQGKYITEFERLYFRAQSYYELEDLDNALASVNKAIELNHLYADAYLLKAQVLESKKEYENALMNYSLYLEWEPDKKSVLFMKALLLYRLNRFEDAISDFKRMLILRSTETNIILYRQVRYESGIDKLMTTENSVNDYIYHYLGLSYLNLSKPSVAISYLDTAIMQNSNEADYFYHRGLANEKLGNISAAISDYSDCIRINSEHAAAQFQLMSLDSDSKLNSSTYFEKLNQNIALYPNYPFPYLERAYHFISNKDYKSALKDLDKSISISSNDSDAWLNRGLVKEYLHDTKGAEEDYLMTISIESNNEKAYLNLGNLMIKQKEFEKSLSYFDLAIFYQPEYALAFYNRAIAHYYLKNNLKACADMLKAKNLNYLPASDTYIKMCK